jgi:hypothetical protein
MFTNSMFQRVARAARFIAVAGLLAAVAVPAGFTLGADGAANAQSSNGGGKGRSNSGPSGSGGGNSALKCIGPDCLDISAAPIPCQPGATYCEPKIEKVKFRDSCEIQVCDVIYGERVCWLERAYDVRICKKERQ